MTGIEQATPADLGAAIRRARRDRDWSQDRLAVEAKLHRNQIGAIERGEIDPQWTTIARLLAGLRIPLSAFAELVERAVAGELTPAWLREPEPVG